jgi:ribosome-associated toxin RatA of RatAB toxin-antitoxin module
MGFCRDICQPGHYPAEGVLYNCPMITISRSALLPYSCEQMFALINDIESYPRFMKGCTGAEILQRDAAHVTARLDLGKAGLHYALTTRNTLTPPASMDMELLDGPFSHFCASWNFRALGEKACKAELNMEFEFSSGLLDMPLRKLFESTSRDLVDAVCRQAEIVYGKP